jgi:hypothetical protein
MRTCALGNETQSMSQNSPRGSIKLQRGDVLRLLDLAQEIVSEESIQPTPLGPNGVESLVQEVCVTDNPWHSDETFAKLIPPLLLDCSKLKKSISSLEHKIVQDAADADSRFRHYQAGRWSERFHELVIFRQHHGHYLVPYDYPENQPLAQWVKRQRYQYKLKQRSRRSTLTDEREAALVDEMGFIWDSHKAAWEERLHSLYDFYKQEGHSNVPSNFPDKALPTWVKCQRRQYKLYTKGKRSTMTAGRIDQLEQFGLNWNPRNID